MKAKTVVEFMTLASSLYVLSKDAELMDKVKEMTAKGKDKINKAVDEKMYDEDGNELEFWDRLMAKAGQAKNDFDEKVEEMVAKFYKKVHIAHVDEIRALNEKVAESDKAIALLEARLNKLDAQPKEK